MNVEGLQLLGLPPLLGSALEGPVAVVKDEVQVLKAAISALFENSRHVLGKKLGENYAVSFLPDIAPG